MDEVKNTFKSRTVWFNILSGAGQFLGLAGGLLPVAAAPWLALATAVVNLGLRYVTTQPISIKA